jgi:hypothetical protein
VIVGCWKLEKRETGRAVKEKEGGATHSPVAATSDLSHHNLKNEPADAALYVRHKVR